MKRLFIILSILVLGMAGCAFLCPVCPPERAWIFTPTPYGYFSGYVEKGQFSDGDYMTEEEYRAYQAERLKEYQKRYKKQEEDTELDEAIDEAIRDLEILFF